MLTFNDQYTLAQNITGDVSTAGLALFKNDINEGGSVFLNQLGRKFNKEYIKTNIVKNQQYYQTSSGTLRISTIRILNGSNYYTPELVTSEEEWNDINSISVSGTIPTHFYIRGFNEIGLYPIPSAAVTNGILISYEPQHVDLTQADFITGTITVSNGSVTVTHSATGFLPQMVGRYLQVTDGTDGKWYRVGAYTSSSVISLENFYEGLAGGGKTFRIGEVMKIPQGYQDAPVYYALERYYLTQSDRATADSYHLRFNDKLKSAKKTYGRSTSLYGVRRGLQERQPNWLDLTKPVTYP